MLCVIYRSSRRADTYLYLAHPADFSKIPEPLMKGFGQPIQVMIIKVTPERKLARLDATELLDQLADPGYYLQVPPPPENLLKTELL